VGAGDHQMAGLRRVDRDAGQDQKLWLVLRE